MNNKVIIKLIEEEQITSTGIIVHAPSEEYDKPAKGKVIAVSELIDQKGNKRKVDIDIDDTVLFPRFGGNEVTIDGEDYILIDYTQILAKVL